MSELFLSQRAALLSLGSLVLGLAVPTRRVAATPPATRAFDYRVDISMLFDLLRYFVGGTMVEEVDAHAGRYRVLITGSGAGVHAHRSGGPDRQRSLSPAGTEKRALLRGPTQLPLDHL